MHRLILALTLSLVLTGCGQGVWLSRQDAIHQASGEKSVSAATRREAKLMTWDEFVKITHVPNADQYAPPGKQRVWLVAVAGDVSLGGAHENWVIFIYNAVTGATIGDIPGPTDQVTGEATGDGWPPGWESFPDHS
jgi:hypothetical protein